LLRENARTFIGVVSDTHGVIRMEAIDQLRGCDLVIHCGDVGTPDVLDVLKALAPVLAVRGNVDRGGWAAVLPATRIVEIGSRRLYVLHDRAALDLDPAAAGFSAVLSGHSHKPAVERVGGVLFLNPGSAGPRRFKLPLTVAHLIVDADTGSCDARIVPLYPS
jgi:putative phosphoesterase